MYNSLEKIPEKLKKYKQWLVVNVDCDARIDDHERYQQSKIAKSLVTNSSKGWNDPENWSTFEEVYDAVKIGIYNAIAFVLTEDDPFVILDLDNSVDDNKNLTSFADDIVNNIKSYSEYSISGYGLHIIVEAEISKLVKKEHIEIYDKNKYIILTGNIYKNSEIIKCQEYIDKLVKDTLGENSLKHSSVANTAIKEKPENDGVLRIIENHRDDTLFSLAGYMRKKGFCRDAIEAALLEINENQCYNGNNELSPLKEKIVKEKATRIMKYKPYSNEIKEIINRNEVKKENENNTVHKASDIIKKDMGDLNFLVDSLIPTGLTLLIAPAKAGKSSLLLNIAYSAATGNFLFDKVPTKKSKVLYLALEDTPRRMKRRLTSISKNNGGNLDDLGLQFKVLGQYDGGMEYIKSWVKENEKFDNLMVIIDTLSLFRQSYSSKQKLYDTDYKDINEIRKIAIGNDDQDISGGKDISIVIAHHSKKGSKKEDFIDQANGTMGLVAGVDTILVLDRKSVLDKDANDVPLTDKVMAKLKICSRDFDEYCYDITGREGEYKWVLEGLPRLSNQEKKIYDLLIQNNNGLTVKEIQTKENMKTDDVRKIMDNLILKNYSSCLKEQYFVKKQW